MIGSAPNILCLLILISGTLHFSLSQDSEVAVSGDDNVGEEMGTAAILASFRFLLGLKRSPKPRLASHSLSTAPAPAPALHAAHHIHHRPPFHPHRLHNEPAHELEDGESDGRAKSRHHKIIVAVVASAGSILALTFFVAVSLACERSRRKRLRSSSGINKVSYDPDPGPELFYLNSLAPILDIESSFKLDSSRSKNVSSNEHDGDPRRSESSETLSCRDEEILRKGNSSPKQPCELKRVLALNENIADANHGEPLKCESDTASCLDEEILHDEPLSSDDDDDESFHSVCNSRSSVELASVVSAGSNLSCKSGECSPCSSSSDDSSSPKCQITYFPSKTKHQTPPNSESLRAIPRPPPLPSVTNIVGNIRRPPPPPPIPSASINCNIPKPPPPPTPSTRNGICIPTKPPPPPPPIFRQPPPPPPCQIQQSTPVGKDGTPLPKLKPLHWDKVRAAPDRSMVWDKIRSSSFELDEQMIESLFGYNTQSSSKNDEAKAAKNSSPGKHVLDNKRLQNITILLKAVNATAEQVREALIRGRGLSPQQLEALAKMAPTKDEEEKLSNYQGDVDELGSAEIFVRAILSIPFAFPRVQAMLYRETFQDEVVHLSKSFAMLEEACKELRSSRLFFRLLEAVLKTGNRMNVGTIRGGARAFKLDTLLKLADVKGADGKTTLLHFVVQEIIRSEGATAMEKAAVMKNKDTTAEEREEGYRVMGLDIVSGLGAELCNVKKTASIDLDVLASSVSTLTEGMKRLKHLVLVELPGGEEIRDGSFVSSMRSFLLHAEGTIKGLKDDEDRVLVHVREIAEYYHGDVSKVDEANPLRIFVIVRDFLGMLDRVCKEVRSLKAYPGPASPFR